MTSAGRAGPCVLDGSATTPGQAVVETHEQQGVIALLTRPDTYGLSAGSVERIDTHTAIVWLAGDRAYKLKRAVRFDYVDFSTVELRRASCEAEVRLNRRTAPSLYRGVRPVTRDQSGALALGGEGEPVDWLVGMARFDQQTLFDRLAARHQLDIALMDGLVDALARLHEDAERRPDRGGRDGMAWVIDGNARAFAATAVLEREASRRVTRDARAALAGGADLLETRRRDGFVRWCHGDLHLGNICLVDGAPTLFDAVEFNEQIACIDVLYDLAFLLMDLWHRTLPAHANAAFNRYLGQTTDLGGLSLLPLFLSCRAAVRAKTSVAAALVQRGAAAKAASEAAAREYLALAQTFLRPPPACLVAIGGFSGSGKSTLARGLAPDIGATPGALVLRSDAIRKALLGTPQQVRLGPAGYAPDVTRRVYSTMAARARQALQAGHAVILDAVFADAGDRAAAAEIARGAGVPFVGLWMDAPKALLAERVRSRVADASDATVDVLDRQWASEPAHSDWHQVDGAVDIESIRQRAAALCRAALR